LMDKMPRPICARGGHQNCIPYTFCIFSTTEQALCSQDRLLSPGGV
jgi:hypothetical protein